MTTTSCNYFSQVRVLVMTWNEKSNDTGLLKGMMGTHDEETLEYFRGTDVICTNVQRAKDSWLGLGGQFVSTLYTHHQKTVVCDIPVSDIEVSGARRLVGFVGGVDITNGRYDNPTFPLFKTLFGRHAGDFYQVTIREMLEDSSRSFLELHDGLLSNVGSTTALA